MILPMAVAAAIAAGLPTSSELTIYNQGYGLVKEVRQIELKAGRQSVAIEDVAAMIEPSSVGIRSLTDKNSMRVLEQNYQYDLISPAAILNKAIGERVRFVRWFGTQKDVLEGTLLSAPTSVVTTPAGGPVATYNGMVIKADDGRIVLNPTGEIEVTSVPAGLISKPTLLWELESDRVGSNQVEVSYVTQGIRWNADYVLTLNEDSRSDLQGWVTIDNQSGATWLDAKLKLLAGDVQRPQPSAGMAGGVMRMAKTEMMADRQFSEESLFEYHLYTLQRPATVRNRETKQISLLEGHDIPVQKKLIVDSMQNFGRYYPSEGEVGTGDVKAQVRLEFTNDTKSGLGMPLPKGNVKVYQRDKSGSVQLLGEDGINHTPRNEKLSLVVGKSFDVVSTRKRTNFRRINDRTVQETYEIEVRNRKETPETIFVLERHYGDWRVLDKSQDFDKLDSESMQFTLKLTANEVKKVTYTVETKW